MREQAYNRLAEFGIKVSVQRVEIMRYLLSNYTHPDADQIHAALIEKVPTLSKTTVYNTLKLFAQNGAIQMLDIDGSMAHFDADIRPHAHFLCRSCGTIHDVPLPEGLDLSLDSDHDIDGISLYYKGTCRGCRDKKVI